MVHSQEVGDAQDLIADLDEVEIFGLEKTLQPVPGDRIR